VKFCGEVERGPRRNWFDFYGNQIWDPEPDFLDPGNFDEIFFEEWDLA